MALGMIHRDNTHKDLTRLFPKGIIKRFRCHGVLDIMIGRTVAVRALPSRLLKITFVSPRMLDAMLEKMICIFSVRLIQKQCIEVQELSDVRRLLREVQL